MSARSSCNSAFTLLELIIVILILGILAAITLSRMQGFSQDTKETALKCELRTLRNQILTYQLHHNGNLPSPEQLRDVLLNRTTPDGEIDEEGSRGPYLIMFPSNPYNGRIDVKAVSVGTDPVPDDSSGWLYGVEGSNFTIVANSSGQDRKGLPLIRY